MTKLIERFARYPVAGAAITLIALLAYWSSNQLRLGFESVWPTIAAAVAVALAVTAILRVPCGSWIRAGIASGMTAFYFFYVPEIMRWTGLPHPVAAVLHAAAIGLLVLLYRALPSEQSRLGLVAGRLNLACVLVLAVTALPLAIQQVRLETSRSGARGSLGRLAGAASAGSPDVWHILFDRYAAADTLKERYAFDNTPFIEALRQRGFVVSDRAYANYQRTGHSVAATMNGRLLDPLGGQMSGAQQDWVPIYRAMRDGSAVRRFNAMGYRTIFAGSWWEPTRFSTIARESITIRTIPQLARLIMDESAAGFWLGGIAAPYLDGRADQCFRAKEKFRLLREIAGEDDRKHVFAHFLVPHPPFVLNADGSCRSLDRARTASRGENYVNQIRFANREVLALVDAILAGPRPAAIVIHSDEGPWPAPYVGDEHGLGTDPVPAPWTSLDGAQLHEKMAILLAVRDPSGKPPRTMPASPVQIYPAILKDHFHSPSPLPPSRHYVFPGDHALYRFVDVGGRLGAGR